MLIDMWTKEGAALHGNSKEQPWQAYPRPQLRRDSFLNLNGYWDFTVSESQELPQSFDRKIRLPFCPESQLSGVAEHFPEGSYLFYATDLTLEPGFHRGRVILHVGAADQQADVFVNGQQVCHHEGGYEAFSCDITHYLKAENRLVIRCRDDLNDQTYPYGKQVMKRGGMWYTPVSGIWQTVWVESVPVTYVQKLDIHTDGNRVVVDTGDTSLDGYLSVPEVGNFSFTAGKAEFTVENPHYWSPEDPHLYDFTLEVGEDVVKSYFALRTLEIKKVGQYQRLCLNGKPYFFHGLLDQGYWSDGLLTPAEPGCYVGDIMAMKKLGFNTLRKHIKVEPEEFYYQCDKLGMIVFQDMVNNGDYSYRRDTVLPTIGIQTMPDKNLHRDAKTRQRFLESMEATVKQLKNHPCICYWTIFNEGWGQFDSDNVYPVLKALDSTRFIDSTSGWFRRFVTDVDSRHVYFKKVKLAGGDKPLVLSEFGGYSYKLEDHSFNTDQTYGYGKYYERTAFVDAVTKLYMDEIVPCVKKGLCAAIYTQVSDVEDETNGLLTYDRQVEKLLPEEMLPIAQALKQAIGE